MNIITVNMKKLNMVFIFIVLFFSIGFVSANDVNQTLENNPEPIVVDSVQVNDAADSNITKSAYLVLDNDADNENIHVGDYVTWTVSVQNLGPDIAQNTKVYDELPEDLQYCYHKLTKGVFNPQNRNMGYWGFES